MKILFAISIGLMSFGLGIWIGKIISPLLIKLFRKKV